MFIQNPDIFQKFIVKHRAAEKDLNAFSKYVRDAEWDSLEKLLQDKTANLRVIQSSESVSRIVFKLSSRYRVDCLIHFGEKVVKLIRIGTHESYNKWKY